MRRTILVATMLAVAASGSASAQMRVQGPRPIDPRLKAQPQPAPQPAPAGGPLQRPSYLEGDGSAPSSGPSSLDLMKQCFDGTVSGSVVNPTCVGYLAGFIGAVRMSRQTVDGYPICLPEGGIANESIVSDVSSYLEENPDALQKSARSAFFLVLSQKYPCDSKTKP